MHSGLAALVVHSEEGCVTALACSELLAEDQWYENIFQIMDKKFGEWAAINLML